MVSSSNQQLRTELLRLAPRLRRDDWPQAAEAMERAAEALRLAHEYLPDNKVAS